MIKKAKKTGRWTAGVLMSLVICGVGRAEIQDKGSKKELSRGRVQRVARYFHRPAKDVVDLRQQGFGYGEIVKMLVISDASKRPVPELLARYRQGVGWGTLSRQLGLNTVDVKRRVDKARNDLRIRTRSSTPTGPPGR